MSIVVFSIDEVEESIAALLIDRMQGASHDKIMKRFVTEH